MSEPIEHDCADAMLVQGTKNGSETKWCAKGSSGNNLINHGLDGSL